MGPKSSLSDFIVFVLLLNVFYFQCNSILWQKMVLFVMIKIVYFFVIFANKLKNVMALWRFKTKLVLAKILQGVFLGQNATFSHYYDPFFAKQFFSPNSTRPTLHCLVICSCVFINTLIIIEKSKKRKKKWKECYDTRFCRSMCSPR